MARPKQYAPKVPTDIMNSTSLQPPATASSSSSAISPSASCFAFRNSVTSASVASQPCALRNSAIFLSCGGSVSVSLYPMDGAQMKQYGVHGIVTRSQQLGAAIRTVKTAEDPEAHFLSFTEGYKLFKGKIADVLRETRAGFNFGRVVLEGIGECKGRSAAVEFQNENLTAEVDGKIVATVPDLICLVDTETFSPVTTDALLQAFTSSTDRSYAARQLCAHLLGTTPIAPVCFQQDTLLTHEGVAQGMSPTATSVFFGLENWTIHLEP